MTDKPTETPGEDFVKNVQAAAQTGTDSATLAEIAQEQEEFEQEIKKLLRENGKTLGLTFGPNEGIASMRQKLMDAKALISEEPETEAEKNAPASEREARRARKLEATKLVRVQIACLNPAKSDLPGEIFTVHSNITGTVKKFVPYNEAGESYHLPFILFEFLKEKKYLQIKDPPKGSRQSQTTKLVPEFAITPLPQLTPAELKDLARAQGAAEASEE
jgi:hypothetical protein